MDEFKIPFVSHLLVECYCRESSTGRINPLWTNRDVLSELDSALGFVEAREFCTMQF